MPKIALQKVAKKIRKKKGSLDTLGDREAARFSRASLREEKLKKNAKLRSCKKEDELNRVGFFKVATKDSTEALSVEEVRKLINIYVHRDDAELERYEAERRPGRPPLPRHADLKNSVEQEQEEFRTGYLIPNVMDFDNIAHLQRWDGTVGSLAQVKFTRVAKEDAPVPADKMEL